MRFLVIFFLVGGVLWYSFSAPPEASLEGIPLEGATVSKGEQPGTYRLETASFERTSEKQDRIFALLDNGRIRQDPQRKKLRRAVMKAAERLETWPCNDSVRRELALAATDFIPTMRLGMTETYVLDGKTVDASHYADRRPHEALIGAVLSGRLGAEDLPEAIVRQSGIYFPDGDTADLIRRTSGCDG